MVRQCAWCWGPGWCSLQYSSGELLKGQWKTQCSSSQQWMAQNGDDKLLGDVTSENLKKHTTSWGCLEAGGSYPKRKQQCFGRPWDFPGHGAFGKSPSALLWDKKLKRGQNPLNPDKQFEGSRDSWSNLKQSDVITLYLRALPQFLQLV